jgi:hypothetical protein
MVSAGSFVGKCPSNVARREAYRPPASTLMSCIWPA